MSTCKRLQAWHRFCTGCERDLCSTGTVTMLQHAASTCYDQDTVEPEACMGAPRAQTHQKRLLQRHLFIQDHHMLLILAGDRLELETPEKLACWLELVRFS